MKISLRSLITVPSVLQMIVLTAVITYVSLRSSRQAVEAIAVQLAEKTSLHVVRELDTYVQSVHQINERFISALASNAINLKDLDPLHRYLIFQFQQYDSLSAVLLGLPTGEFRTIHRADLQPNPTAMAKGNRHTLVAGRSDSSAADTPAADTLTFHEVDQTGRFGRQLKTMKNLDVRDRPWYRQAAETGQSGWSGPDHMSISSVIGIGAYTPIYSDSQTLQGVISAEISLDRLSAFLNQLEIGATGEIFIMERDGQLVAESTDNGLCRAHSPPEDTASRDPCQTFSQRQAGDSTNATIRAVTRHLNQSVDNLTSIQSPRRCAMTIDGKRWFLYVSPYSNGDGLDWLIVTAISETDFMADANASLRNAVGLSLLILAGAIALGAWIAQRIARPLVNLNRDVQALAQNTPMRSDWTHSTGIREVESLQSAFYHMASQLSTLLQTLEQQVADRTASLASREADLKLTQRIARMGSWRLDAVTGQISWSEELLHIYGLDQLETVPNYPEVLSYLPSEDRNELSLAVDRAIAEGKPYEVEHRFIRPNGDILYIISRGAAVFDERGKLLKLVGTATDISDRKRVELALLQQQELFRQVTETIREVFYIFDFISDRHLYISPAYEEVFGCSIETLYQNPNAWQNVVHPDDRERVWQETYVTHKFGNLVSQYRIVRNDGAIRWIEDKNFPVYDHRGRVCKLIGVAEDITTRKQAELTLQQRNAQLKQLAVLDSLTQVGNRRLLESTLHSEWHRHRKTQNTVAVIMLDIDHFKAFNDQYGHLAGDDCLCRVAQTLKSCAARPFDFVSRYGGEEFVILLPETNVDGAATIAQRIQQAIAQLGIENLGVGDTDLLTVSMGIAVVQISEQMTPDMAIAQADAALYQAKQTRNTYCVAAVQ